MVVHPDSPEYAELEKARAEGRVIEITHKNAAEIAAVAGELLDLPHGSEAMTELSERLSKAIPQKARPNRRTVAATIRGSVPDGKLAKARITLSRQKYGEKQTAGYTQYAEDRKTVIKVNAPDSDDALGITVRGHEGRHATRHTRGRVKPMTENEAGARQIVLDVNIETTPLPRMPEDSLKEYKRAHLAIAAMDVRNIVKDHRAILAGRKLDSMEVRNARLLGAVRAKAMLRHYGSDYSEQLLKQPLRINRKLNKVIGVDTAKAINEVIKLARNKRTMQRAISMLTLLLEERSTEYDDSIELEGLKKSPEGILPPPIGGSEMEGHMGVIDLRPKTIYTAKERTVSVKYAPDGVHLNPSRYVSAVVSDYANGIFSRRVRRKAGGTVLIDASGSMGVSAENLTALLKLIPTATVAYYSGWDGTGKGKLAIYANGGLRYAGILPRETLLGGNAIDLPAMRWLLKQTGPLHLVSDLSFVGGRLGSEFIAKALVQRASDRGLLTVHVSLDAAYEAFGGKEELADAENKIRAAKGMGPSPRRRRIRRPSTPPAET